MKKKKKKGDSYQPLLDQGVELADRTSHQLRQQHRSASILLNHTQAAHAKLSAVVIARFDNTSGTAVRQRLASDGALQAI